MGRTDQRDAQGGLATSEGPLGSTASNQPSRPVSQSYPIFAATVRAASSDFSAYSSDVSIWEWPRTACAASTPNCFRMMVAAECRSWCGCQRWLCSDAFYWMRCSGVRSFGRMAEMSGCGNAASHPLAIARR